MIEINLVPDVKQELIKAQRIRSTVITGAIIIGFISIAVVVLLAIYVFAIQTVRGNIEDTSINDGSAKLEKVTDLSKTLTIQNQLTQIDQLNSQKSIDSRLFDVLQAIIPASPNDVTISALSLDSVGGTITIQGQAPNGYSAAEVFKKTISDAQVNFSGTGGGQSAALASDISLSNTSYGDSTGAEVLRFTISFTYDPDVFSPASTNVSINVPNSGDATDSYLGVPTSIFAIPATDLKGGQ
jgi:Tfp pilus assembly protein PilN